jgi:hypothetical protein
MIISRTSPGRAGSLPVARRPERGFSLTELLIGASISSFILVGVLSAFLMLGRSGMSVANYSTAEAEIRRGVEEFSQDVRMASNVTWNSASSITLTLVPPNAYSSLGSGHANKVTYALDAATSSFYRKPGLPASTERPLILVRDVSEFSFLRYNRSANPVSTYATNPDAETKFIRIFMNVRHARATLVATNTTLVLAGNVLRNKPAN